MIHDNIVLDRTLTGYITPAEKVKQLGLPVFYEDVEKSKQREPEHPARHTPSGVVGAESKSTQSDLKEGSGDSPGVFILSEGLPPVPVKLVTKIQRGGGGDYVDMAELLRDNMEMEHRQPSDAQGIGRQGRREMPDILSWITCFGMYVSVLCDKYPDKVRQMFAYQTIMVREARRCGGKGWLAYDMMFRQQAANNPKVDWSVINNSLYSTTFLGQQNNRGRTCQWCMETDHTSVNCAMAPTVTAPSRQGRSFQRDVFSDERQLSFKRPEARGACFAWNEGRCTLPYCRYKQYGVALCHTAVISTFVQNVGRVTIKTATVLALFPTDQQSRTVQGHQKRELLSVRQAHWHSHVTAGLNMGC